MTNDVPYVCAKCRGRLNESENEAVCNGCGARFPRLDYAYANFAGEVSFDDWWAQSEDTKKKWLEKDAPQEEEYELGLARNYVLPLLDRLGYKPGNTKVLSAGCGMASDVDMLNDLGYHTWGIDVGERILGWGERDYPQRLARADIREMPYPDDSFDFVLSLNTIEHIGTVGDSTEVTPDYLQQRKAALDSLLRVTKPGGHVLLSGLSRTIPLDFGHIQDVKGPIRYHSPWEPFLLNFNDIRNMCNETGEVDWTRPLPLRGFFSWTRLRHNAFARPLLPFVDWLFGSLPPAVYGSWISPFWISLSRRKSHETRES